ncbi:hypothetical protein DXG01_016778, partial [Tephrocybe rancida]
NFLKNLMNNVPPIATSNLPAASHSGYHVDMAKARKSLAISPLNQDHGRSLALSWVFDRISDDHDMEHFLESMHGPLLDQYTGYAWCDSFNNELSLAAVEDRAFLLLYKTVNASAFASTNMDQQAQERRATICINASMVIALLALKPVHGGTG